MSHPRDGAVTARTFIAPAALFAVSVALAFGAWFIGHRSGWDFSAEVGTGRNRTTAAIGMVIVGVFAAAFLGLAIRVLWLRLGFARRPTRDQGDKR